MGAFCKAVDEFRAADAFRAAPGIEIALGFEVDAVLFDAHVAHTEVLGEFADRQALGALELVDDLERWLFPISAISFWFIGGRSWNGVAGREENVRPNRKNLRGWAALGQPRFGSKGVRRNG